MYCIWSLQFLMIKKENTSWLNQFSLLTYTTKCLKPMLRYDFLIYFSFLILCCESILLFYSRCLIFLILRLDILSSFEKKPVPRLFKGILVYNKRNDISRRTISLKKSLLKIKVDLIFFTVYISIFSNFYLQHSIFGLCFLN